MNREEIEKQLDREDKAAEEVMNNVREENDTQDVDDDENTSFIQSNVEAQSGEAELKYLVRGARLVCRCGTHIRKLNLPLCHGVYIGENPVMHEYDCIAGDDGNISWFGVCSAEHADDLPGEDVCYKLTEDNNVNKKTGETKPGKKCQPEIVGIWNKSYDKTQIADSWDDDTEILENCNTLTTQSYLVCSYGGIIEPISSGQEYEMKEDDLGENLDENGNDRNAELWREIVDNREAGMAVCGESDCNMAHERHPEEYKDNHGDIHGSNYYTAVYQYEDGEIIDVQHVRAGEAAVPPQVREIEGYTFQRWDEKKKNYISDDLIFTAIYLADKIDTTDPEAVKEYIWDFFRNAGFTEYMTAGVLGNIHVETGGKFNPEISRNNYRFGLFQIGGEGRGNEFKNAGRKWAEENGWPESEWENGWKDLEFQCQFALNECLYPGENGWSSRYFDVTINGVQYKMKGTFDRFEASGSSTMAALIWAASYERCPKDGYKYSENGNTYYTEYQGQQERCEWAETYYKEFCGEN